MPFWKSRGKPDARSSALADAQRFEANLAVARATGDPDEQASSAIFLGEARFRAGDLAGAGAAFQQVADAAFNEAYSGCAWSNLFVVARDSGDRETARGHLMQAARCGPAWAASACATMRVEGWEDDARAAATGALTRAGDSSGATGWTSLSEQLTEMGMFEEAAQALQKASEAILALRPAADQLPAGDVSGA